MLPKRSPITSNTDEVMTVVASRHHGFQVQTPAAPLRGRAPALESADDCEVTRMLPGKALDSVPPPAPSSRPLQTRVHLPRRERALVAPPPPPPPSEPAYDTLRPVTALTADQIEANMHVIRAERMSQRPYAMPMASSVLPPAMGNAVVLERGRRSLSTWGMAVGGMAAFGALLVAIVTGGVGSHPTQMAAAAAAPAQQSIVQAVQASMPVNPAPMAQTVAPVVTPAAPAPMAYAAPARAIESAPKAETKIEKAEKPEPKPVAIAKPAAPRPVAVAVATPAPAPKPAQAPAPKAPEASSDSSESAPAAPVKAAKASKPGKADGEVATATAADEEARKQIQDSL